MQLQTYLDGKEMSPETFAERLTARGVPTSVYGVRKWLRSERMPRPDTLRAIRDETDGAVTADDFLDGGNAPEPAAEVSAA